MAARGFVWVVSGNMAAAEVPPLIDALIGISVCIGRPPALPRSLAGCAELLQALVNWAAPGPEGSDDKKVPERSVPAIHASLLLLDALRAKPHDSHVTSNGVAGQGPGTQSTEQTQNGGVPLFTETNGDAHNSEVGYDFGSLSSFSPGSPTAKWVERCSTAPLLILCATHSHETPWSNEYSRQKATILLGSLLDLTQSTSVVDLLRGRSEHPFDTFGEVLGLLGPRLRKETWESHPEAMFVFAWLLPQVPRPYLSDLMHRTIPPSLILSDDYRLHNKGLGIRCLDHIIKNVPGAALRQYNRAMVVYDALRRHLYSKETEIIELVLPCLRNLFPVFHKPPPPLGTFQKEEENPVDQVLQLILTNMEMEQNIDLRRVYAKNLPAFLDRLGYRLLRHMRKLMQVITGYLEVSDGPEEVARLSILETLRSVIKHAWPRISRRAPSLLKALVKLLYDISSESSQLSKEVTKDLLDHTADCLILMDNCCRGNVKITLQALLPVCKEPLMVRCIRTVLENT